MIEYLDVLIKLDSNYNLFSEGMFWESMVNL